MKYSCCNGPAVIGPSAQLPQAPPFLVCVKENAMRQKPHGIDIGSKKVFVPNFIGIAIFERNINEVMSASTVFIISVFSYTVGFSH